MNRVARYLILFALALTLTSCATSQNSKDPFEGFNRAMFTFNDKVDQYALKPVATVYKEATPSFVQTGVYNFFGNIADVWTAANNLLQGRIEDGMTDVMRVAINTSLGIVGLIDIASEVGLSKHKQDFGVTLGVWGVKPGPYVVLPFFGPSTMRDTVALPVDYAGDLWRQVTPVPMRNGGRVLRLVDQRAGVLDASNLIEDAALDRYQFIRDAYLQRRASKVNSGKPSSLPKLEFDDASDDFKEEKNQTTEEK